MTELEAKMKVCERVPVCTEVRVSTAGYQQRLYEIMEVHCIGSACGKWRWNEYRWDEDNKTAIPQQGKGGSCGMIAQ